MKVVATRRGYFGEVLREPGSEFTINSEIELGSWMALIEEPTEEKPAAVRAARTGKKAAVPVAEAVTEESAPEVADEATESADEVM